MLAMVVADIRSFLEQTGGNAITKSCWWGSERTTELSLSLRLVVAHLRRLDRHRCPLETVLEDCPVAEHRLPDLVEEGRQLLPKQDLASHTGLAEKIHSFEQTC